MSKHFSKIIVLSLFSLLLFIGKVIFADSVDVMLGINNTIARIMYQPAFSTGFFTSGDVSATITGLDITGTLYYTITGNGTYIFPYLRGTGPYTSGLAYSTTNLWNHLTITDSITWIDKIFPIFDMVIAPDGQSIIIYFSDDLPGVTATLNGSSYISGSLITIPGTYSFVLTDIAGNRVSFSFTVIAPQSINHGGGGGIGAIIETPPCTLDDLMCVGYTYVIKPGRICDIGSKYTDSCFLSTGAQTHTSPGYFSGSIYGLELTNAYMWAHAYRITTKPTIQQANMTGFLLRKHLAKMISEFAIQFVGIQPDTTKKCSFFDMNTESEEMQMYAILACQLGLMGLKEDGTTPKKNFYPNKLVNRAQFGTILSRLLFGDTYNIKKDDRTLFISAKNGIKTFIYKMEQIFGRKKDRPILEIVWYSKHLQALKAYDIMRKIDRPMMLELRGYVMLMLMRADMNGIIKQRPT